MDCDAIIIHNYLLSKDFSSNYIYKNNCINELHIILYIKLYWKKFWKFLAHYMNILDYQDCERIKSNLLIFDHFSYQVVPSSCYKYQVAASIAKSLKRDILQFMWRYKWKLSINTINADDQHKIFYFTTSLSATRSFPHYSEFKKNVY